MNKFVTDTMAYVLHLEKRKMPETTKNIFQNAENGDTEITVPAIVIAEIGYLSEKKRIDLSLNDVSTHLEKTINFKEQPLNNAIINTAYQIDDIPELHDRLIAGTAKYLDQELITNDPIIEKSKHVKTIWK